MPSIPPQPHLSDLLSSSSVGRSVPAARRRRLLFLPPTDGYAYAFPACGARSVRGGFLASNLRKTARCARACAWQRKASGLGLGSGARVGGRRIIISYPHSGTHEKCVAATWCATASSAVHHCFFVGFGSLGPIQFGQRARLRVWDGRWISSSAVQIKRGSKARYRAVVRSASTF